MPIHKLPIVRYEGRHWFFDRRLKQLRPVAPPLEFRDLNDFEVAYFEAHLARQGTKRSAAT